MKDGVAYAFDGKPWKAPGKFGKLIGIFLPLW